MSAVAHSLRGRVHTRMFWASAALCPAAVLTLARVLEPDVRGIGTHTQLGLPPCAFLTLTQRPCPACGLTTAFAHMARGHLLAACHANAVGLPLFLCALVAVPACLLACMRASPVEATLKRLRLEAVAAIIGLSAVLSWLARIVASA